MLSKLILIKHKLNTNAFSNQYHQYHHSHYSFRLKIRQKFPSKEIKNVS